MKRLLAATIIISCIGGSIARLYAQESGVGLRDPENISRVTEFDEKEGLYRVGTKLGNEFLEIPDLLTPEEYLKQTMQRSMQSYYRSRNDEEFQSREENKFDFTDMRFDLGPAEKIFGPGGVQIKTSGSAAIKLGYDISRIENPSLSVENRKSGGFDFDEQINLNINARVGDKVSMDMNYNAEATFDIDTKKIKLHYEGKEDEIIRLLEAGNISFPTNSSLIKGARRCSDCGPTCSSVN